MTEVSTQLRVVWSKDPELLAQWVSALPFKIEIKGNPILKGNRFYLFFILPPGFMENDQSLGGNLDGG